MVSQTTVVVNPSGIHARPASLFVKKAGEFASKVTVRNVTKGSDPKDAKSILTMMALGMAKGNEIEISAEGEDEAAAVAALVELVESGCGE